MLQFQDGVVQFVSFAKVLMYDNRQLSFSITFPQRLMEYYGEKNFGLKVQSQSYMVACKPKRLTNC